MKNKIHNPYNRFKLWLKDNNKTYLDIAKILGKTETGVAYKINGQSDFTLSEILVLKRELGIDSDIFFADDVAQAIT